jgi:hypothetical protein
VKVPTTPSAHSQDARDFKKDSDFVMKYDEVRPVPYRAVLVSLADGTRMLGMWTGERWWSVKGEIAPAKWELEERKKKKTDKLRKAIPRDEKLN